MAPPDRDRSLPAVNALADIPGFLSAWRGRSWFGDRDLSPFSQTVLDKLERGVRAPKLREVSDYLRIYGVPAELEESILAALEGERIERLNSLILDTPDALGEYLRQTRAIHEESTSEVAKRFGRFTASTFARYEAGREIPAEDRQYVLAAYRLTEKQREHVASVLRESTRLDAFLADHSQSEIGQLLANSREITGLTQTEVARNLGVDPATIVTAENRPDQAPEGVRLGEFLTAYGFSQEKVGAFLASRLALIPLPTSRAELPRFLIAMRQWNGLSLDDVARALNRSRAWVGENVETTEAAIEPDLVPPLLEAYDVPPALAERVQRRIDPVGGLMEIGNAGIPEAIADIVRRAQEHTVMSPREAGAAMHATKEVVGDEIPAIAVPFLLRVLDPSDASFAHAAEEFAGQDIMLRRREDPPSQILREELLTLREENSRPLSLTTAMSERIAGLSLLAESGAYIPSRSELFELCERYPAPPHVQNFLDGLRVLVDDTRATDLLTVRGEEREFLVQQLVAPRVTVLATKGAVPHLLPRRTHQRASATNRARTSDLLASEADHPQRNVRIYATPLAVTDSLTALLHESPPSQAAHNRTRFLDRIDRLIAGRRLFLVPPPADESLPHAIYLHQGTTIHNNAFIHTATGLSRVPNARRTKQAVTTVRAVSRTAFSTEESASSINQIRARSARANGRSQR